MENKRNLTENIITGAKPKESRYLIWDAKVGGLGVDVQATGVKSYVFLYPGGKKRWVFAKISEISLHEARESVLDFHRMLRNGVDPKEKAKKKAKKKSNTTLEDVAELYYEVRVEAEGRYSPVSEDTLEGWRNYIDRFIKGKRLGKRPIRNLGVKHANSFMDKLSGTPAYANKIRSFLKGVFDYAIKCGLRKLGTNPWVYVDKCDEKSEQKRFKDGEIEAFIDYMNKAQAREILDGRGDPISEYWVALIWLLYFTGARPSELKTGKWENFDFIGRRLKKTEHKTAKRVGEKYIEFSEPAMAVVRSITRKPDNPFMICGRERGQHLKSYKRQWRRLREETGVGADVYSIRRYFASEGKRVLQDSKVLSKIIGHASESMTERYAGEVPEIEMRERQELVEHNETLGKELLKKIKGEF